MVLFLGLVAIDFQKYYYKTVNGRINEQMFKWIKMRRVKHCLLLKYVINKSNNINWNE